MTEINEDADGSLFLFSRARQLQLIPQRGANNEGYRLTLHSVKNNDATQPMQVDGGINIVEVMVFSLPLLNM
jgi:hypothetical protein